MVWNPLEILPSDDTDDAVTENDEDANDDDDDPLVPVDALDQTR